MISSDLKRAEGILRVLLASRLSQKAGRLLDDFSRPGCLGETLICLVGTEAGERRVFGNRQIPDNKPCSAMVQCSAMGSTSDLPRFGCGRLMPMRVDVRRGAL